MMAETMLADLRARAARVSWYPTLAALTTASSASDMLVFVLAAAISALLGRQQMGGWEMGKWGMKDGSFRGMENGGRLNVCKMRCKFPQMSPRTQT